MANNYTAKYFIDKFSKIPDEKWCKHAYDIGTAKCAVGFCGMNDRAIMVTPECQGLRQLFFALMHIPESGLG